MRYSIAAAAVTAAFMMFCPLDMHAQKKKKKTELIRENSELMARIDSLESLLRHSEEQLESYDRMMGGRHNPEEQVNSLGLKLSDYNNDVTDSLLSIWYSHGQLEGLMPEDLVMDSVRFTSDVPDSVYIERLRNMNSFIELPYNEVVRNYIILYSQKLKSKMGYMLGLCNYYMPIFEEAFLRYNLPLELRAMAIIESALNPTAVSRAGARGTWQFMYNTARQYGLTINSYVDERFDPVTSADAAARYLRDAYNVFGDWNLAISSYNCGAGNVSKAIRRSGGKRDFWSIYPYLPRETRGYVPAFVGALYTMTYYKEHGITPMASELPVAVDTIKVNKMLHFKQVNELVGIPMEDLKRLNPQYVHDIVPGKDKDYILRIPYNYTNSFVDMEDSLYRHRADTLLSEATLKKVVDGADGERIVYKVKSGDYLGRIASRYRVSVNQIKRWNNLKSNNLRIGQRLVIYRGGKGPVAAASNSGSGKKSAPVKSNPALQNAETAEIYVVKSGDSLYTIAKKYSGVSAQDIMSFNGIGSSIKPGMKLKIPKI